MRSGKKNITCQTCELFLVAEEHHFQRGESGEGMEGGGGGGKQVGRGGQQKVASAAAEACRSGMRRLVAVGIFHCRG